jgi:hypothetical protein
MIILRRGFDQTATLRRTSRGGGLPSGYSARSHWAAVTQARVRLEWGRASQIGGSPRGEVTVSSHWRIIDGD